MLKSEVNKQYVPRGDVINVTLVEGLQELIKCNPMTHSLLVFVLYPGLNKPRGSEMTDFTQIINNDKKKNNITNHLAMLATTDE